MSSGSLPSRSVAARHRLRIVAIGLFVTALVAMVIVLIAWRPLRMAYHLRQSRSAITRRDVAIALRHLVIARALEPERAEVYYQMARAHRSQGQLSRMRTSLENAWRLGFDRSLLEREQRLAKAQTGQLKDVEPQLIAALTDVDEPRAFEVCEALVNGYFANLSFLKAESILDAWQKDYPKDAQPHIMRGYMQAALFRPEEAIQQYEVGLAKAPWRTDGRLWLAQALMQTKDMERTETQLQRCLAERPHDLNVMSAWAEFLFQAGRMDEASLVLDEILQRVPDNSEALTLRGRVELAVGQPAEAVRWLQPAVDQRPYDPTLRYALAQALEAAGQQDAAAAHFAFVEEAEEPLRRMESLVNAALRNPRDVDLRYNIGMILLRYSSPRDGIKWLRSALELDASHRPTHQALGDYFAMKGDAQAARHHLQMAARGGGESTP